MCTGCPGLRGMCANRRISPSTTLRGSSLITSRTATPRRANYYQALAAEHRDARKVDLAALRDACHFKTDYPGNHPPRRTLLRLMHGRDAGQFNETSAAFVRLISRFSILNSWRTRKNPARGNRKQFVRTKVPLAERIASVVILFCWPSSASPSAIKGKHFNPNLFAVRTDSLKSTAAAVEGKAGTAPSAPETAKPAAAPKIPAPKNRPPPKKVPPKAARKVPPPRPSRR